MSGRITELFNNNVFTDAEMKARLPKKVYNEVKACKLDKGSADIVAQAVRDWAIEKGATHFTHVFEPLTMLTAEKHDSFVSLPDEDGKVMMDFTEKNCVSPSQMVHPSRQVVFVIHPAQDLTLHGI